MENAPRSFSLEAVQAALVEAHSPRRLRAH